MTISRRDFCLTCGAVVGAGVLGGGGIAATQDSRNVSQPRQFWKLDLGVLTAHRSRAEYAIFEQITAESSRNANVVLLLAGGARVISSISDRIAAAAAERCWICWGERLSLPNSASSGAPLQVAQSGAIPAGLVSFVRANAEPRSRATGIAYDDAVILLDHHRGQWQCFAAASPDVETFASNTRLATARRIDASFS